MKMARNESTKVLIVGAGIGGLCTAVALGSSSLNFDVTVLEQSEELAEVGAGVQISPNWVRLLYSWNLKVELEKYVVKPGMSNICRWQDGRVLGKMKMNAEDYMEKTYDYPLFVIHRADLLKVLSEKCKQLGVTIRTDSKVTSFESGTNAKDNTICLASGEKLTADIVIGADGGRSTINAFVAGHVDPATNVGDSAYRALFPIGSLEDSDLEMFKDDDLGVMRVWLGPDSHIVAYLVRNMELLNMVIIVPDSIEPGASENWKQRGDVEKLREFFKEWNPSVRRLLGLIEESYLWRLRERPVLQRWVHDKANLALLGDSAHPMLPYAASGAACCGEDAATLVACLERVTGDGKLDIHGALKAYEALRVQRATDMVKQSRSNRETFHLRDGPEQQMRDEKVADPVSLSASMAGLHGFDAIKEVEKYFQDRDVSN